MWGGVGEVDGHPRLGDGAAYNPALGEWRMISDGPLDERYNAVTAWTGTEMLVWGGKRLNYIQPADGAAYDPATDTWRSIAPAPIDYRFNVASVWTGREWVVAVTDRARPPVTHFAAYDPVADEWRSLPGAWAGGRAEKHLVWIGDQLVVFHRDGMLLRNPESSEEWIPLPPLPDGRRLSDPLHWTGRELLASAFEFVGASADYTEYLVAWDPATDSWRDLAEPPDLYFGTTVWADGRLISLESDMVYDYASDSWWEMPVRAWDDREEPTILWCGDRVFVWGGTFHGFAPDIEGFTIKPSWPE